MQDDDKLMKQRTDWWKIIGLALLIAGASIFIENQFHTGWLIYLPLVVVSVIALISGMKNRKMSLLLVSLGMISICLILPLALSEIRLTVAERIGGSFLVVGSALLIFFLLGLALRKGIAFWACLVSGVFFGLGAAFLGEKVQFVGFVLWLSIGISVPMLIWGFARRLFGLIIAGFILLSSGLGVSVAWSDPSPDINSLTRTGIMLITFALGWGGISAFSKRCLEKIAWWPLIPAGVLSMSGLGLFIGGGANATTGYIGNTLSLALIVLGVYVLLLRSGFNKKP